MYKENLDHGIRHLKQFKQYLLLEVTLHLELFIFGGAHV